MVEVTCSTRIIGPGEFEPERCYYPRVLNAQIHPLVRFFSTLSNERLAERYVHMHPEVQRDAVMATLSRPARYFRWGGADLFHVTAEDGHRHIVVVETNSCPSGQKSMPRLSEDQEQAGYFKLLERSFLPILRRRGLPRGGLAVVYDKNPMEAEGYAATLADLTGEPVALTYFPDGGDGARFVDGVLQVRDSGAWMPIRAALRYVTQRPWNRIPPLTRTAIYNPILVCLAGGRNKLLAARAYDFFNAELAESRLQIQVPETIWDVAHAEVPMWVARMGGIAVVKNPYSNAGQGVWTIASGRELEAFMAQPQTYDRFVVQALIGNDRWSSRSRLGRLYHVGTFPDRKNRIYVADLRFMVGCSPEGYFPVAIYARRAASPLVSDLGPDHDSWSMLGTNLSHRLPDGSWASDTQRLLLVDSRDYNRLGLGLDDLIEGYIQTVLAMTAIDRMAESLVTQKGRFRRRLFGTINPDPALLKEIMLTHGGPLRGPEADPPGAP